MIFDLLGALCSLLSTYYFIRLAPKAWLVGIMATCINGWLYWTKGIYGDMTLEGVYFLSMIYGWYHWRSSTKNSTKKPKLINELSNNQWLLLFCVFCFSWMIIYNLLTLYTNSSVAFLDALTTTLSLIAQWLMCHKIIITWILWGATDLLYVLMYLNKNLPFHSVLMIIYTGLAVVGFVTWSRIAKNNRAEKNNLGRVKRSVHTLRF